MSMRDRLPEVFTARNIQRFILVCGVPALVFYAVSLVVMTTAGFTLVEILRDPAQQTRQSSFLGFLSNIGCWLWLSAAVVCFFRVAVFGRGTKNTHKTMLVLAGGFSLFLAVDDFFLIHDRFITEGILIPLYAFFVFHLLRRYGDRIAEIEGFSFVMALGLLAMSVIVDALQEILPISYGASQTLEEGFKFMGAAAWLYFCYRISAWGLGSAREPAE